MKYLTPILIIFFLSCKAQDLDFKPDAIGIRAKVKQIDKDIATLVYVDIFKKEHYFKVENRDFTKWTEYFFLLLVNGTRDGYTYAEIIMVQESIEQVRYDKQEGLRIHGQRYKIKIYN